MADLGVGGWGLGKRCRERERKRKRSLYIFRYRAFLLVGKENAMCFPPALRRKTKNRVSR
jgi:hypothetical protein